jgi:hypothetical protein
VHGLLLYARTKRGDESCVVGDIDSESLPMSTSISHGVLNADVFKLIGERVGECLVGAPVTCDRIKVTISLSSL